MNAIVYYGRGDIRYEEAFPVPAIASANDVRIKVHYCGICGSDLHEYKDGPIFFAEPGTGHAISDKAYPHCMGHEMSGEIVDVGASVDNVAVGDRVVVEVTGTCFDRNRFPDAPNYGLSKCGACSEGHYNACEYLGLTGLGFTDGGFAEYVVTDKSKVVKFDENLVPMDVAALIQPIAVSWHAVATSNFTAGSSALVLGGGPIGLTTIFALKGHDAGKVVVSEPALARRLLAEKFNVEVFDPTGKSVDECVEQLKAMSPEGKGFHHSYDCLGVAATFDTSVKAIRIRGTATNVAVWAHKPIDYYPMMATWLEKIITGSICFLKKDFEQVVAAMEAGKIPMHEVRQLITSKIHLEDGVRMGFDELVENKAKHIKILFLPKPEYRRK